MTFNIISRDDGFVDVQVTGIYEATEQSETLDPEQARDAAEKLQALAEAAENQ